MTDLFQVLAVNSLRGAVLILAVLVLRTLLRKTPRRVICLLWSVVALRLLLPIRLTAFFGLLPGQRTSTPIFPESTASYSQNALVSAAQITKATAGTVLSVVPRLWLVGAVLLLLWTIFRAKLLCRRLSDAKPGDGVWTSDRISTPFAFGLLRPRIYLPTGLPEEDLPWVLAHEHAHIRRRDTCRKALGLLLLAVYWFQPLCWLGWRAFCRDLELACDERATEGLTLTERKAYALALLRCSAPVGVIGAAGFGEKPIRVRIRTILQKRSQPRWVSLLLGTACALLLICLCFEAPAAAQSPAASTATLSKSAASASAVPEDKAADWDSAAPEARAPASPEYPNENPDARPAENAIRWDFSGPLFPDEASGSNHAVVRTGSESDRFSVHESASSGEQTVTITLRDVGGLQGLNTVKHSREELEQPDACCVWHTEDEEFVIYWEIQTTP